MTHTLKAEHLGKRYQSRWVVEDVSFSMNTGEVIGLLGPNGAGKTTSFYMLVGLVKPNRGTIMLDDENITQMPVHKRARKGLSYLPQEPSIFRKLSVRDNIMAILEMQKDLDATARKDRCQQLLEEFHLTHIQDNISMTLSGGERRRTEIARALATSPKFVLLDEPFAGVDPISVIDIKRIITHLQKSDIGVLITDHNVRETLDICERAYIVNNGSILASGTPDDILANEQVRRVYLGEKFSI